MTRPEMPKGWIDISDEIMSETLRDPWGLEILEKFVDGQYSIRLLPSGIPKDDGDDEC